MSAVSDGLIITSLIAPYPQAAHESQMGDQDEDWMYRMMPLPHRALHQTLSQTAMPHNMRYPQLLLLSTSLGRNASQVVGSFGPPGMLRSVALVRSTSKTILRCCTRSLGLAGCCVFACELTVQM